MKLTALLLWAALAVAQTVPGLRPPATPLIAHDPYFSIWSMADAPTDQNTRHWTGTDQQLDSLARIDGKPYRLLGTSPRNVPAMVLAGREITPTRTTLRYAAAGVQLALTFLTPALPDDLDILSRPVTYISWEARSTDNRPHELSVFFQAAGQLAVNTPDQPIITSRHRVGDLQVIRAGSLAQPVLAKAGDNLRIDWGWLYLALPPQAGRAEVVPVSREAREEFSRSGQWPADDDLEVPRPAGQNLPALAALFDFGSVTATPVSRHVLLAYDDNFSIQYLHRNLRPWWRRNGMGAPELLRTAARDYDALRERSRRFDEELTARLKRSGGDRYAELSVLAYRQTLAAHKLVADLDNTPLYFSKENFSNGCIATVDVTYPSAPFFLLLNPQLLKAQLRPMFDYASLPRWKFPFAPHDLGTYPLANGQVYGGGERTEENQMPVEESGNMLLLTAALARAERNADFARRYWPLLTRWARYLREKGMDPENQLSTDDFAGHLAHNTNLSLKAILALGAYAQLAEKLNEGAAANEYRRVAQEMATRWPQMAEDGDHYRLAFDKPGTWSQKYNLVWDKLLGLELFPPAVARKEIAYYKTRQNKFGLPLDNRATYTKLDWIVWTATLTETPADFQALVAPLHTWLNETPTRVPMSDWYDTIHGRQQGFQARSVVGGVYIKALADEWRQ